MQNVEPFKKMLKMLKMLKMFKMCIPILILSIEKTSPPSAWVAAMRSVQEQNCKTKLYGNIFETPLKLFAKLSPSQPANPQLGAEIALISQLS